MREKLHGMGFTGPEVESAIAAGIADIGRAIDYIESAANKSSAGAPPSPASQHSGVMGETDGKRNRSGKLRGKADDDFEKALALSREDEEARRIDDALKASKADESALNAANRTGVNGRSIDHEYFKAVQASLKDVAPADPGRAGAAGAWKPVLPDVRGRVRKSLDEPCGLYNIGNTCYLNSLLQVYFHLPDFRRAIMSYRPPPSHVPTGPYNGAGAELILVQTQPSPAAGISEQGALPPDADASRNDGAMVAASSPSQSDILRRNAIDFVLALQLLFASMALGNQNCADPSGVALAMRDANGNPIEIGAQQDAQEFNNLFLVLVERALSAEDAVRDSPSNGEVASGVSEDVEMLSPEDTGQSSDAGSSNVVKDMFTAHFKQEVRVLDSDDDGEGMVSQPKSKVLTRSDDTIAIMVDAIAESDRDLYSGLDDYTQARIVDYRFDGATTASSAPQDHSLLDERSTAIIVDGGVDEHDASNPQGRQDFSAMVTSTVDSSSRPKPAIKSVWFTRLPPVLVFYLHRVRFNREKAQAEKVHDRYDFGVEIALDRYLEANREASELARESVRRIKKGREEAQVRLKRCRRYPAPPDASINQSSKKLPEVQISIPEAPVQPQIPSPCLRQAPADDFINALQRVRFRLQDASDPGARMFSVKGVSPDEAAQSIAVLDKIAAHDMAQLDSLKRQAEDLALEEKLAYANLDRVRYRLQAVLVHDGAPSSGHYWTFIRDLNAKEAAASWMRLSDSSVSRVTEEEMLSWSLGGNGRASAYCLIYTSLTQGTGKHDWNKSLPATANGEVHGLDESIASESRRLLAKDRILEVEEACTRFDLELAEFKAKLEEKTRNTLVSSILELTASSMRNSLEPSNTGTAAKVPSAEVVRPIPNPHRHHLDPCKVRSLVAFCRSTEQPALALAFALSEAWAFRILGAEDGNLFEFVAARLPAKEFPALRSAGAHSDTQNVRKDSNNSDVLIDRIIDVLSGAKPTNPPLSPGDMEIVTGAAGRIVAQALSSSQHMRVLMAELNTARKMFWLALRAHGLAIAAMEATLKGRWNSALWLWFHLTRGQSLAPVDKQSDRDFSALLVTFHSNPIFNATRAVPEVELFARIVLIAASDHAANALEFGGNSAGAATALAQFVAEHAVRMYTLSDQVISILVEDWRERLVRWRSESEARRGGVGDQAIEVAQSVVGLFDSESAGAVTAALPSVDVSVAASMEQACANPSITAQRFESLREQLFQSVGLTALPVANSPDLRSAARQLYGLVNSHTAAA